jgi:hypothetical protein
MIASHARASSPAFPLVLPPPISRITSPPPHCSLGKGSIVFFHQPHYRAHIQSYDTLIRCIVFPPPAPPPTLDFAGQKSGSLGDTGISKMRGIPPGALRGAISPSKHAATFPKDTRGWGKQGVGAF